MGDWLVPGIQTLKSVSCWYYPGCSAYPALKLRPRIISRNPGGTSTTMSDCRLAGEIAGSDAAGDESGMSANLEFTPDVCNPESPARGC